MTSYTVIGQPAPRFDGPLKVTGQALYSADVVLPGTLWVKVLRSPFAHARITRIDTSQARDIPGVHAVLTGADTRGVLYGRRLRDVPVLADELVRFIGEPVAAVAAEDKDTALKALNAIEVEYEELPAVFDPLEAMKEDAPLLHPDVNNYVGLPQPLPKPSNVFVRNNLDRGDVSEGFAQSDIIVEGTYTTPAQHQAYLEPHTCLVWIDDEGVAQVWASNKAPYALRRQLSDALSIAVEKIQVNPTYIGGDFGGKGSPLNVPICYFLALHSGRPVRMVMDYTEEFMAANPRHPSIIRMKTGVNRDGTLVAHHVEIIYTSGAYGGFKPGVNIGGSNAGGPYRIPNVHIDWSQVYTNTVPGGHMRAPGDPQTVFAIESHMDVIARRLEMDPMEFRLKNIVEDGDETSKGASYTEVKGKETLEAAVKEADYLSSRPAGVGRGIAFGDRAPGGGESNVGVTLNPDGSVVLGTPIFEQGSGTYTMLSQIVSEELGISVERVGVDVWTTGAVNNDAGVGGARVARSASIATHWAIVEVRQEMLRLAAELLGWPEERLSLQGDDVVRQDTGERHPWAQLLARVNHPVMGRGVNEGWEHAPITSFTAQIAEVSVDEETGEVKLLRFTTAHDVGTVLNQVGHQGQIAGSVMQGIGYALMEELRMEDGRVTNPSFGDYKIPTIMDVPELSTILLESDSGVGPYKIKSIGESPVGPVAPAIANAIEDAVGVRIRELPITAEKVYRALQAKKQ